MRWLILLLSLLLCACEGEAEQAVRRSMIDPDATQFRDVKRCRGDAAVWQGEANGKNRLGAFVGFKAFYYANGQVAFAEDPAFVGLMNRCFSNLDLDKDPATAPAESAGPAAKPSDPLPSKQTSSKPKVKAEVALAEQPVSDSDDRCWMDYCPCDKSDPDYGGADVTICRNLKAGLTVSDDLMSGAAGMRDARRQLREHKAEYGDF